MTRAKDDCDELLPGRAEALQQARRLGHNLTRFRVRPNDATKLNAFCWRCGALCVLNLEPSAELAPIYGVAVRGQCVRAS